MRDQCSSEEMLSASSQRAIGRSADPMTDGNMSDGGRRALHGRPGAALRINEKTPVAGCRASKELSPKRRVQAALTDLVQKCLITDLQNTGGFSAVPVHPIEDLG